MFQPGKNFKFFHVAEKGLTTDSLGHRTGINCWDINLTIKTRSITDNHIDNQLERCHNLQHFLNFTTKSL